MISFDDGHRAGSPEYILDQLRGINNMGGEPVRAGFFLIGKDKSRSRWLDIWSCNRKIRFPFSSPVRLDLCPDPGVENNTAIVKAIEEQGHSIMVHSYRHANLADLTPEELEYEIIECYKALRKAGVSVFRYFRPPYMAVPAVPSDSLLRSQNWGLVLGTPSGDGSPFATEESVEINCKKILAQQTAWPALLVFHDFRGIPNHRFDFKRIIDNLVNSGYMLRDFDPQLVAVPLPNPR